MEIKLLGTGCANCKKLEANTVEAIAKLGIDAEVEKVTDIAEIMGYGVIAMPTFVIDREVKVSGRVPGTNEIIELLRG